MNDISDKQIELMNVYVRKQEEFTVEILRKFLECKASYEILEIGAKNNVAAINEMSSSLIDINQKYDLLKTEHENLQKRYDEISNKYNEQNHHYSSVNNSFEVLKRDTQTVQDNYEHSQKALESLKIDYENLQKELNDIKEKKKNDKKRERISKKQNPIKEINNVLDIQETKNDDEEWT